LADLAAVNEAAPPAAQGGTGVESIRRRYGATLLTRFLQLGASFVTAGIVPRVLGPEVYGNYNYLLITASNLRSFLDPSTRQAFFTFSSQDRHSGPLTRLYGLVLVGQLGLILAIVGALAAVGRTELLWPGQVLDQILWITLLDWVAGLAMLLDQLSDSKGLTVRSQIIAALVEVGTIVGLIGMSLAGRLTYYSYVWLNLLAALVTCVALGHWLFGRNAALTWAGSLRGHVGDYLRRWWRYASPLILLEMYTPVVSLLGNYLVQLWYGSKEQGFFSLAFRWSAVVLVFTTSALSIVWREVAHALAAGDRERAAYIYERFSRLLTYIALVLCAWLSLSSPTLVLLLAGDSYRAAVPVMMVMAFYPLQQTYGQLTTAIFKASGQTTLYRNVNILYSIPNLLLTYFLLASPTAWIPGLGLGAMGMALRMVVYGLIGIQAYEWLIFRYLQLNYWVVLGRKLQGAIVALSCALGTLSGVKYLLVHAGLPPFLALLAASGLYFSLMAAAGIAWPELAGLSRAELVANLHAASRWVRSIRVDQQRR
jgi:O-antigen/teichoic acid export membrane protein